jgi:predicted 3-demethylubiquinone-9 3-methyltransferase (glyoxalase superfamily)
MRNNVTQKITTCLWFDAQAEDAADFYVSVFDGSKILNVARYGDGGPGPAGQAMTVEFEIEGRKFLALNGARHSLSMRLFPL